MLQGWVVIVVALVYIGSLFAIASYGDRVSRRRAPDKGSPFIYALSLAVYCTSWTFFGSVGLAAATGFDFLTIYIGAGLMIGLAHPLVGRIVQLSKNHNITSIADFLAARYGKNQALAAIVTVIAVIGIVPYISLQLKAIANSLTTILEGVHADAALTGAQVPLLPTGIADIALFVTLTLAAFAILFGTRHIDATEHQEGLVLAVAAESVVKLIAFLTVGVFVTFWLFDGPAELYRQAAQRADITALFTSELNGATWLTMTFLAFVCIILLPRQFHVTVVENKRVEDVRKAAWLFPLYLVAINIFVVPIAVAGLLTFTPGTVDSDMFVLALPLAADAPLITLAAFIGGLSAATAMVIVASVALAIMVCNDIVVPAMLRHRGAGNGNGHGEPHDMGEVLLNIRRTAIFAVLLLAYAYYRMVGGGAALASIGLLSFAAIAQFAPAFFGGLIWRRGTAAGAIAGILSGFAVWAYTLLLPSFVQSQWIAEEFLQIGLFGFELLRPQALFYTQADPLTHGVMWSLAINLAAYVGVSLARKPAPIERLQANLFVNPDIAPAVPSFRLWRTTITVDDLKASVARYLGSERTERSFDEYAASREIALPKGMEADSHMIRFTEHLLASAIGAASSRLVLSLLIQRRNVGNKAALKLLDDASAAIQYNRDLLQTAIDHVRQGLCVFDTDLRLICWNRQFRELLDLPPEFGRVGVPLDEIVRYNAVRGEFGLDPVDELIGERLHKMVVTRETFKEHLPSRNMVLEVRTNTMPDDGFVVTFTDITEQEGAAAALSRANETLEGRVRERTEELMRLNAELEGARAEAEQANIGKTRFLAAASHDILQPLNAARLYVTSLVERSKTDGNAEIVSNIDASLESVEEILGALLQISRLDTGALKPEISSFPLDDILRQLAIEFTPMAQAKGVELRSVPCSLSVRSDRRLLRRMLQNLVSNAVRYTPSGKVLIGCRRAGGSLRVEIHDTGPGIPEDKRELIFQEFQRIDEQAGVARGLGLGLSIVERICGVLDHPVSLFSRLGIGSRFSVEVPVSSSTPVAITAAVAPLTAPSKIAGARVLCIDNERKILSGMKTLLSGWGCHVIAAADTADALDQARESDFMPEVLLIDYHLDRGTGLDAIATIRDELGQAVPAVLVTADRSVELRDLAREKGLPILNKPVKPAALRAILAQRRVRRRVAAE